MMSGDVQPRKRKDKRRKKDELGVEEPRGTAAVFGEGDVLMHSHHEHSTGGHWCAKIIFFSLLSVLVTLIVLIILENRGLTELEANSVESRYSGVLDGWIEDTADDDHHDEHTLDLKHHSYEDIHDDGDDDNQKEIESEHDEDDHNEEEFNDENEEGDDPDDDEDDDDDEDHDDNDQEDDDHDDNYDIGFEDKDESDEKNVEEDDDDEDDERMEYKKYSYEVQADENDDDDDDDENDHDDEDNEIRNDEELIDNDSQEQVDEDSEEDLKDFNKDDDNNSNELKDDNDNDNIDTNEDQSDDDENDNENEDDEENETENDDDDEEVERIEREVIDEVEAMSSEKLDEDNFEINKEDDNDNDEEKEETNDEDADTPDDDEDFIEPPIVEQIPVPSGKPYVELEDEPSSEKPTDTLAEEEEYEKRQEQIRLEKEESSSQMWLKLAVGGALLLATHAVIRRSAAPGDTPESEDSETREETPTLIDRRMTLLPRETAPLLTPETKEPQEIVERLDLIRKTVQSVPVRKQESDDEDQDEKEVLKEEVITKQETKDLVDKELYSDEEEEAEDEEEIVEEKELSNDVKVETEKVDDSEPEEVPDDVEIIDDEQIEEEIEDEEEDEEEISDVDDEELLSRLEAKYGRLPEPERPGQRHSKHSMFEDGGNSIEYEWPGEPSNPYWRKQLDIAEEEIRQHEFAGARARVARPARAGSVRARYLAALALDEEAALLRSNDLLSAALQAYLQIIKSARRLPHDLLIKIATKTLEKIYFRGNYRSAEPVYRLLMYRFPNDISYRHNLTVIFLMTNNLDLADDLLKETLQLWPNDKLSLAHYGFVLKVHYEKLEESVEMFSKALENDRGAACEPRFYYHFGDALLLLGRYEEADEVHQRAAAHGHFLSPAQRSLYNVDRLKSRPWWRVHDTPYVALANALERSWKEILKEGEAARALYEKEREGLKERGEWSQLDLFVRGQEILGRCKRAPVTCSIIRTEPGAANCRRGQVKFSLMAAGTHVRPHVGPTNCRLRMHLGLSNTKQTYIRVDKEIRQWKLGKVLLFDDSFEHEVWHNGTGARLVLIVDVWHPDLSAAERRQLPAI